MDREPGLTDQFPAFAAEPSEAPAWLVERLERGIAQAASGQGVPIEPVLERLRASIARMEEKRKTVSER